MAVLALAVAGAALAPAGYAAIGWTIGTVVGQMLFPGSLPDQTGPRVGDLRAQQSQYGVAIPILYGTTRASGNVIWSTDLIETVNSRRVGGKGGPSQTQTTYSYRVSMAVMLGEGPILGVRKIWADGKLIYNVGASADFTTAAASNTLAPGIAFYTGSETQEADPTMEAYLGVGNVPAYRGRAYVVFSDFQLEAYGNRRPNFTFEAIAAGTLGSTEVYSTPPAIVGVTAYWDIATDGDKFIALDHGAPARYSVSTDGENWSGLRNLPTVGNARAIEYLGGRWIILCTNETLHSTDGDTWTAVTAAQGSVTLGEDVAWSGQRYVAITNSNVNWSTSEDGVNWTLRPRPATESWLEICWTGSQFVALALNGVTAISPDGLTWTLGSVGITGTFTSLDTSGTHMVAVQGPSANARRSTDGINWTAVTMPAGGYSRIVWGGDYYMAVRGGTTNAYARSFDGLTWQSYNQAQNVGMFNVAARAGTFVTVNQQLSPNQRMVILRVDVPIPGAVALLSVVSDICDRAGLASGDIDVTALTDVVDGYAIGQQMSARAAIEQLQRAFHFDAVESAAKVAFRKRGGAAVATVVADDLAAHSAGDSLPDDLSMTRQQEVELPAVVSVIYIDKDADYAQNTQQAQRITTLSTQQTAAELAISMSADRARAIAETLMYDAWTQRQRYTFQTSRRYAAIEPADVVTLTRDGTTHTLRVQRKVESRSGVIQWEAVAEEASVYTQSATGGAGPDAQGEVRAPGPTTFVPLDAPALRDEDGDSGFYAAASGASGWRGAVIYRSSDGGASFDETGAILSASAIGTVISAQWSSVAHPNVFDETSRIAIDLPEGTLSGTTELAVLEGANFLMVGAEILQFKNAVLYAPGSYEVSGLLRGRRGTEWAIAGHPLGGERVVALSAAGLRRFPAELSSARMYKAVTIGRTVQATPSQSFTYGGVNQIPFAPVSLGGGRDAANNLTITWLRRSRQGMALPWNYDPPLAEASELYDVEIWNTAFSTLRRTFSSLTTPTASYTAAQQTSDSGGLLSSYGVRVFQRSAVMARGYTLQGII